MSLGKYGKFGSRFAEPILPFMGGFLKIGVPKIDGKGKSYLKMKISGYPISGNLHIAILERNLKNLPPIDRPLMPSAEEYPTSSAMARPQLKWTANMRVFPYHEN